CWRSGVTGHAPRALWLPAPEVGVLSLDPVCAGRAENVEVVDVLARDRIVRDIRRDDQHLAGMEVVYFAEVLTEPEAQRALDDVRELLGRVHVERHDRSLLAPDLGKHRFLSIEQAP